MIKVVVVGAGFIGLQHIANIEKVNSLQLVAVVDQDIERIKKGLNKNDGNFSNGGLDLDLIDSINTYNNFEECIEKEAFDAVHICVPTLLHYSLTKKALECNKHVLLEKPFCLNIDEAEELISLSGKQSKILMIGHVVRFMPAYEHLKKLIDEETYGSLRFLSLFRLSGTPNWGQWDNKSIINTSGGALFDLVIHDIDYAQYVLGQPDEIHSSHFPGKLSPYDYISAIWNYKDNPGQVRIEGGNTFHSCFPFQAGFRANFEQATICYSSDSGDIIKIADDNQLQSIVVGNPDVGFFNEIQYFADCIVNDLQPSVCLPASSLLSIKLCYNHINK